MTTRPALTLQAIAARLGLELKSGDAASSTVVTGLAALGAAGAAQLSFYHNPRFHQQLRDTRAAAVILRPAHAADCPTACLLSDNPYLSYAQASRLFELQSAAVAGIHASAVVDESASVSASASVAAHAVIGANAHIGDDVVVGPNTVVGDDCVVGDGTRLYPNVTLYQGVVLGKRCIVHAAAVLGSDGFGFARSQGSYHKIAQLGGVVVGDDVEIGAGTSIDRGALDDTVIENGVKIDNQVQIAHNVRIGAHSIICGCSAIAGSSVIGKNCTIAGAVGVINHVSICDDVTVTAMSLVNQNITSPGVYSSGTGLDDSGNWRKNIVRFKQLDDIWRRLLKLERFLKLDRFSRQDKNTDNHMP